MIIIGRRGRSTIFKVRETLSVMETEKKKRAKAA